MLNNLLRNKINLYIDRTGRLYRRINSVQRPEMFWTMEQQKKWKTSSKNGWGDFQKAASPKWCVENCLNNIYIYCICVIVYSYIWECLIKLLSGAVAFWKFGEETSENEINKCYSRKFLHEYVTHIWWTSYIQ